MGTKGRPLAPRVTLACTYCGAPVERRASEVARLRTGRVFCSDRCLKQVGAKPRRGTMNDCVECGVSFYAKPNTVSRFCSRDCHNTHQKRSRITLTCTVCNQDFSLGKANAAERSSGALGVTCSRKCDTLRRTTNTVGREHNGRPAVRDHAGYIRVWEPDHPNAFRNGWVLEHRLVMEQVLGRLLATGEHVHHINGQKWDNRPENLAVLGHSEHSVITQAERKTELAQVRAELAEYRRRYGPLT